MNYRSLAALAAIAALAAPLAAHASINLVTNGSFETGDFTGWTQGGNTGFTGVDAGGTDGTHEAFFGPVGSPGTLSQTIATTPGDSYQVSFDLANDEGTPNFFDASFGGVSLFSFTNGGGFGFTSHGGTIVAGGSSANLTFTFQQNPAFMRLDNVVVTDLSTAPEPAAWGLMIVGMFGAGAMLRRRKAALA